MRKIVLAETRSYIIISLEGIVSAIDWSVDPSSVFLRLSLLFSGE